jgi:murein DD-endopeptidase MepM/ murein hydrolase activator NlpD
MTKRQTITLLAIIPLMVVVLFGSRIGYVWADDTTAQELQEQIAAKKAKISDVNSKLDTLRKRISGASKMVASLENDVALLENEAAIAELDITATETEIEQQNLEMRVLEADISLKTADIARQRAMLSDMLFTLNQREDHGLVATFFGAENFHEAFNGVAQLEDVNRGLKQTVDATQAVQADLEADKADHEIKIASLNDLASELATKVAKLASQQQAKEVLMAQTENNQAGYITLMSELRQEQQSVASQIAALQNSVEEKLKQNDQSGEGSSDISWPLRGIITALFHDTSYPFRNLFEHPGLDIAVPVGTSVAAAAPGYVAWAKTGSQYGNYVMIIHTNGMATLYAHLMRMDVKADQFVSRGDQIGLSGGRPGMQGAGLSTGPHLHFEVRKGGIPVNPMSYLSQ